MFDVAVGLYVYIYIYGLVLEFTTMQEGIDPYICAEGSDGAARVDDREI